MLGLTPRRGASASRSATCAGVRDPRVGGPVRLVHPLHHRAALERPVREGVDRVEVEVALGQEPAQPLPLLRLARSARRPRRPTAAARPRSAGPARPAPSPGARTPPGWPASPARCRRRARASSTTGGRARCRGPCSLTMNACAIPVNSASRCNRETRYLSRFRVPGMFVPATPGGTMVEAAAAAGARRRRHRHRRAEPRPRLVAAGWEVLGLSRSGRPSGDGVAPVRADLADPAALAAALTASPRELVAITAWTRQDTEAENIAVNGAAVRNLLAALRAGRVGAARRPDDRAQALPRPVRGVRAGRHGRHAVPRGRAAAGLAELLLRPGGRAVRRGRAGGFTWSVHRAAHGLRLRRRQRDEHGADPRGLRDDLPGAGPALRLPRLGDPVERRDRRDRRRPAGRADHLGRAPPRPARTRRSTSPTATCSAGAGCGRSSPRTSGWSWEGFEGEPRTAERRDGRHGAGLDATSPSGTASSSRTCDRLASWWHTDGDLGREIEVLTDMNKCRDGRLHRDPGHPRQLLRLRRAVPRRPGHPLSPGRGRCSRAPPSRSRPVELDVRLDRRARGGGAASSASSACVDRRTGG